MRNRTVLSFLLFSLFFTSLCSQTFIKSVGEQMQRTDTRATAALRFSSSLNVNNLWLKVWNNGNIGADTISFHGLTYPLYNGNMLYQDNICWVGQVNDEGTPLIRTGGATYRVGVQPGSILNRGVAEDPGSESVRVYRCRPDFQSGDLSFDVAASEGIEISKVTPAMISHFRQNYAKDLAEWPWDKGAPYIDKNENGKMDPGENPGIQNASQVLWFRYNDLDGTLTKYFAGDPPIGLEIQVTLWAYKGVPNLEDVIFKRYRLLYRGTSLTANTAKIDSMFLSQWVDADIGTGGNDLGGCDTILNLTYGYNGTRNGDDQDAMYKTLHLPTPGIGYVLLQGPLVAGSGTESGIFNFSTRTGSRNLPMTSCVIHMTGLGDGIYEPVAGLSYFLWNVARGYRPYGAEIPRSDPWLDFDGKPTKFMYSGDPVTRTGWTAARPRNPWSTPDFPGGNLRFYMNTGPFAMALGDTQEVVVAVIASAAPTSLENVTWLKNRAKYVRAIYPNLGEHAAEYVTSVDGSSDLPGEFALEQNFPNPFNPSTKITFSIPYSGPVKLSVFDLLGREIRILHEGFLSAGQHRVTWDGHDASGKSAPSGVYFNRLTQGDRHETRKILLLR